MTLNGKCQLGDWLPEGAHLMAWERYNVSIVHRCPSASCAIILAIAVFLLTSSECLANWGGGRNTVKTDISTVRLSEGGGVVGNLYKEDKFYVWDRRSDSNGWVWGYAKGEHFEGCGWVSKSAFKKSTPTGHERDKAHQCGHRRYLKTSGARVNEYYRIASLSHSTRYCGGPCLCYLHLGPRPMCGNSELIDDGHHLVRNGVNGTPAGDGLICSSADSTSVSGNFGVRYVVRDPATGHLAKSPDGHFNALVKRPKGETGPNWEFIALTEPEAAKILECGRVVGQRARASCRPKTPCCELKGNCGQSSARAADTSCDNDDQCGFAETCGTAQTCEFCDDDACDEDSCPDTDFECTYECSAEDSHDSLCASGQTCTARCCNGTVLGTPRTTAAEQCEAQGQQACAAQSTTLHHVRFNEVEQQWHPCALECCALCGNRDAYHQATQPDGAWVFENCTDYATSWCGVGDRGGLQDAAWLPPKNDGTDQCVSPLPPTSYVTERVSLATDGREFLANFFQPRISGDGLVVAFVTDAALVAGDVGGFDTYVRDRRSGVTARVSVPFGGRPGGDSDSFKVGTPSVSADGRYVAFVSASPDLVSNDMNQARDVFVRDRVTGTIERVSVASDGSEATGSPAWGSSDPSISADGRFVAFTSSQTNLVPGDNNQASDIFVHDRLLGITERVSLTSGGIEPFGGHSTTPAISADGRFVAFESTTTDLVTNDTNSWYDVFVHDRSTHTTRLVSTGSGANGNLHRGAYFPSISADGRYIAFHADASNLVSNDTNDLTDVFVYDQVTQTTERVNVSSRGEQATGGGSTQAKISGDGRFVAFSSTASNLIDGESNVGLDIYVRDRIARATTRVSVGTDGRQANGWSELPAISQDGRTVTFESGASNLVPGDFNGVGDIFVRSPASQ